MNVQDANGSTVTEGSRVYFPDYTLKVGRVVAILTAPEKLENDTVKVDGTGATSKATQRVAPPSFPPELVIYPEAQAGGYSCRHLIRRAQDCVVVKP